MLTSSQCRAARALLGWSPEDLAGAARVDPGAVADFETGAQDAPSAIPEMLARSLAAAGVVLEDDAGGRGVRLREKNADATIALGDLNAANDE
jgi:transcriptional regulator with XRE-family HTH domain